MSTIDFFYEDTITKLTAQNKIAEISLELRSKNTNSERVLYVYEIIKELNSLPQVLQVNKDETVSIYYRNQGNKCFQINENYQAWQYYNLSLMHAPENSESYCLAVSNRSAVFYNIDKFKQCLEDIRFVYSLKYPKKIQDKLMKREAMCLKKIADLKDSESEAIDILKLHCDNHQQYTCASNKIKVIFTPEMGQHVVANEDINTGEVIAQESPYLSLLLKKSQFLFSCSYCLSRKLNLLPCPVCCYALYCSKECMECAFKESHAVECPLIATLFKMEFTKLEWLALRTTIKARNDHESWEDLFQTISTAEANKNTPLHGMVEVNGSWVFESKYYASIHVLTSNIEKRSISDIFQKSITAAVFLFLLKEHTTFLDGNFDKSDPILQCVAGLLLLHTMTSPTNMHSIDANLEADDGNFLDDVDIAAAPYAFQSLLNHSCAPNVCRFNSLGTSIMSLVAIRPIRAGMQLFDNYGFHHALLPLQERRYQLKSQYKFLCSCEACVNNWPTYLKLDSASYLPAGLKLQVDLLLNSTTVKKLQQGCVSMADSIYLSLCRLIDDLDAYAPCKELANCQEALKQCFFIYTGLISNGYGKTVEWRIPPKV